jgi:hypothetical protein
MSYKGSSPFVSPKLWVTGSNPVASTNKFKNSISVCMVKKYTKEELEKYIFEDNLSYEKIGELYNITGAAIKKAALRYGLKLPKRRSINSNETFNKGTTKCDKGICLNCGKEFIKYSSKVNKFCSNKCQGEYKHKKNYEDFLKGGEKFMRGNYNPPFKDFIIFEQNGVCAICSQQPIWNGKPLVFVLDHIDGNAANNRRDNLRCICPNCDSQLDTFKSKNKNGARSYYRYHKYDKNKEK